MRFLILAALLFAGACASTPSGNPELARWRAQAERVTITRDDWGIAHVRGRTDADAVFGMIYAQAEDDFNRVETNYLTALGRTAEAEGEKAIWADLRARLYMDPDDLRARYAVSPDWLKRLMDAWADGLNYYLATHPEVRPRAIARFEPWMALSFTEGSIGGDIERIDLAALEAFYVEARPGARPPRPPPRDASRAARTVSRSRRATRRSGHALLLINPHTSFFFRSELQVTSDEGLNAYGAATWGQFFIYQGFNEQAGWMHTSSGVDVVDEFVETIERKDGKLFYRYGNELRPVETRTIGIAYRAADGSMASRWFETYRTHHGPIVREAGGKWVAFAMMHKPVEALQQSFLRTKATDFASFLQVAELKANSLEQHDLRRAEGRDRLSPPAVHSGPRRPLRLYEAGRRQRSGDRLARPPPARRDAAACSTRRPAGSRTPTTGPIRRRGRTARSSATSRATWTRSARHPRGLQAVRLLQSKSRLTLEGLRDAAYDPYQTAFARLIPGLVAAWDKAPESDPLKAPPARARSRCCGPGIIAGAPIRCETTLAMFWGERLWAEVRRDGQAPMVPIDLIDALPARRKLEALASASDRLKRDFGRWHTPWGEVNRFQRLTGDIVQPFSDAAPSIPVAFTSGRWGSLASFGARAEGRHRSAGTGPAATASSRWSSSDRGCGRGR